MWLLVCIRQQVVVQFLLRCCFQCVAVFNMLLDPIWCSCNTLQLLGYISGLLQSLTVACLHWLCCCMQLQIRFVLLQLPHVVATFMDAFCSCSIAVAGVRSCCMMNDSAVCS